VRSSDTEFVPATFEASPLRDEGEHRVRLMEQEALLNVRTMLELCAAGELRCSEKTSRPSAATMGTVASNLVHGDFYLLEPIASFAWPLLIQSGGLAKNEGGRLQLTPRGRTAMRKPPAEVIADLWRRWQTHAVIDEFGRIEEIKGQRGRNVLSAAKPRRQVVATAMARYVPADEWTAVDSLFIAMRRGGHKPTIARSEMALWRLYVGGSAEYGSLGYDGPHRWDVVEGRYTLAVLFEYAGTLGLVDLDYVHPADAREDFRELWGTDQLQALSRYDGLRALRLTALGRYATGLAGTYEPVVAEARPARPLKVLANLDIVAVGAVSQADRLLLSAYAEQTGDRVWSISAATLLAAVDTGRKLAELTAFLTSRTEHELPEVLTILIGDVARRVTQLTDLGHARVIECADPAVAALIVHDRALRGLCRPIGDRHIAVPIDQEFKFRKALLKVGHVLP
jgi:XPB/Ssl2-like helicase family protein